MSLCGRECNNNSLTAAKDPQSTRWIWQSCWSVSMLGLQSLQSALHNWEEASMPTHTHVEHHLCCIGASDPAVAWKCRFHNRVHCVFIVTAIALPHWLVFMLGFVIITLYSCAIPGLEWLIRRSVKSSPFPRKLCDSYKFNRYLNPSSLCVGWQYLCASTSPI